MSETGGRPQSVIQYKVGVRSQRCFVSERETEADRRSDQNRRSTAIRRATARARRAKPPPARPAASATRWRSVAADRGASARVRRKRFRRRPVADHDGAPADQGGHQATTIGTPAPRLPTPLINTPQTVNVVPQQIIQEQARHRWRRAAQRSGHHLQRRRRRPAGRQPDHPRLRRAQRHLPRRRPRSRLVHARHFRDRARRGLQGAVGVRVRPRLDRRRDQHRHQAADRRELHRRHRRPAHRPRRPRRARCQRQAAATSSAASQVMGQDIDTPDRDHVEDQALGRRAVGEGLDVNDQTKATLQLHLPGRGQRSRLRASLSAGRRIVRHRRLTNAAFTATAGRRRRPIPRNNWYGIASGPLADIDADRHPHRRRQIEHEFTNDLKLTNTTRYVDVDRFARATAPRSLGTGQPTSPRSRPRSIRST